MIEQLALVIVGIVIGSVLGVEYSLWRAGRKFRFIEEFLGFDRKFYKSMSLESKRRYVGDLLKAALENLFPEMPRPQIPSRITTLSGNEFFVPTCPQCGYAATPVKTHHQPGVMVNGFCPNHGSFSVLIPETPENKEEE